MPNIANWVSTDRAEDAWKRICDKPTSVVIVRGNAELEAQTVRLEMDDLAAEITGQGGTIISVQRGRVFGVRDHCSSAVPDTNIRKGDRFNVDGTIYRVISVIKQTGEIQAIYEANA
jgi:hypothetical protein